MTVRELIEKLHEFDPEAMVVKSGYEGGLNEITDVFTRGIRLNVNDEWYYGDHSACEDGEDADVIAVFFNSNRR